jgi:excisionase family DNA binding protein
MNAMEKRRRLAAQDSLLKIGEAAELANVSRWLIDRWLESGALLHVKLPTPKGELVRIPREALIDFIAHRMKGVA